MIRFKEGNLRIPKWNRKVFMVAGGTTAYRKYFPEYKLEELVMIAFKQMLEENGMKMDPLEVKGLINYAAYGEFADHFQDQLLCQAKVHDYLGLDPLYNVGIKTGGATGGSTILNAAMAIASGYANVALAAGWERMDEVDTRTGNFYISRLEVAVPHNAGRMARGEGESEQYRMGRGHSRCAGNRRSVPEIVDLRAAAWQSESGAGWFLYSFPVAFSVLFGLPLRGQLHLCFMQCRVWCAKHA